MKKNTSERNGTRVPVELLVHLVTDSEGKPELYYSFVNDITERKRAAEALRASEAFVRGVLNAAPEHVVVLDEHGVVSAVNEPWERFALEEWRCDPATCPLGRIILTFAAVRLRRATRRRKKRLKALRHCLLGNGRNS